MTNFDKVGEFMKTFGQEVKNEPSFSTNKINELRVSLIQEELDELKEAMNNKDLLEVADALTDLLYVTNGIETPELDARLVLKEVLSFDDKDLILKENHDISEELTKKIKHH